MRWPAILMIWAQAELRPTFVPSVPGAGPLGLQKAKLKQMRHEGGGVPPILT
jgi:hypothetical protein